ncbi:receptor-type tyrosine-protein phosphatase N2 isoform X2 [Stegostoma tigrinum]|uniref:receptor-type tyrosine-protein phosphatase N2 isoform X2 n=1 Tax=Stegostoma tigrinum TaxID=3053191 RepID=UPI00286FB479|nr:receptor-type tyrosine-protein phosphatase N2 isoform X2 [Stegostoma tigrinum]
MMPEGCLFEADVCKPYEICVNDGIFGRCQLDTVIDVDKYEVSPADLQHLQTILHELSLRGLMWHDDITQQVIAKELSRLHQAPHPHPEAGSSDSLRATQEKVASEEDFDGPDHGDLQGFNSLHQYLQLLRAFSQPANPMSSHNSRTDKSETAQSRPFLDDFLQSNREKSPPSHFLAFHRQFPDNKQAQPGPLRLLKQERNKLEAQGHAPVSEPIDKKQLIELLESYLTQKLAVQAAMTGNDPDVRFKEALGSWRSKQQEGPNKDSQRGYLRIEVHRPKVDDRLPEVKEEKVLHKSSAGKIDGNNLLSNMDENFVHSVVQQLGTQHVNLDSLTSKQLDELSDAIASALQVVDDESTHDGSRNSFETEQELRQKEEEKAMKRTELDLDKHDDEFKEGLPEQSQTFKTAAESDEVKKSLTDILNVDSLYTRPLKNQVKMFGSSSKENFGIENVKSNTITREVTNTMKSEDGIFGSVEEPNRRVDGSLMYKEPQKKNSQLGDQRLDVSSSEANMYGYIMTQQNPLSSEKGLELMEYLAHLLKLQMSAFEDISMLGPAVIFQVKAIGENVSTADVVNIAEINKEKLEKETGLKILRTGMREKSKLLAFPQQANEEDSTKFIILTIISIVCIIGVLIASGVIYCLRHRSHEKLKAKLGTLGHDATTGSDATNAYQELCRQRMAVKTSERPETAHASRVNSVSSQFSDGPQPSPSTRSSTSSWCEEPVQSNMDISTGHMILSYMEDHLRNKNRLEKEWEALAAYQAEPNTSSIAEREENEKKNRSQLVVPYDHSRITLKVESSHSNSDYINASPIMDHDPRNPAYIAAQGPLPATVADFWQMVWENGCVVIVMLTPLTENGVKQCYHYWPDEGSNLYHIYEVNLVSEHIWCEDFLVRSFYLKNLQTNETRTVTQFHFLSWFDQAVPSSTRILLDFRRKVNKCYRGRSCPIIVHCSDGAGRCGTYILIDMVLNRMAKGAKEIDIAATLEHLRDQRPMMVQTKDQFEFALTAVAEEVNAILKALPQ